MSSNQILATVIDAITTKDMFLWMAPFLIEAGQSSAASKHNSPARTATVFIYLYKCPYL